VDDQGRRYVDAISSWWCMALGHDRPELIAAIREQAGTLQHSILGNLAHPRAAELAGRLAALMPSPDRHVLFASDGASAVEQALKIAVQYAAHRGQPRRTRFAALRGAYHGDTLGALSVGFLDDWHRPFRALVTPALTLPPGPLAPPVRWAGKRLGSADANGCSSASATRILDEHADELAAVIVEPLCLGASGMQMYGAAALRELADWCRAHAVPLIVDEIATGFGRTGRLFAFEHAGIDPDIVCVGKALTGGYLPLSATVVRDEIYETFTDQPEDHTLQHGHTFCGNPIAAAAACAALELYGPGGVVQGVPARAARLADRLLPLAERPDVREVRCLGLIGAVELMPDPPGAPESRAHRIRRRLQDQGILLRPLGNVLYLLPPLVIDNTTLDQLVDALAAALDAVPA
jgi:adenosylmethionine-8-amino-7-oxononanoate aminotransferase